VIGSGVRWASRCAIAGIALVAAAIILYRFVPPPVTPLMLLRAPGAGMTRVWVPLDAIAPALLRSVIAAEDARFFAHDGVDWRALEEARQYNDRHGGAPRHGGSTITMQCARNVFLWPAKSYLRKMVEIGLAHAIELAWGKRRILEIYLNVIEWGRGIYGAEAAARANFGISAARLDARQAALMAAALPNPLRWVPALPTRHLLARAAVIERRAAGVRLDGLGTHGRPGGR
jgi:monofunctional biosynthetic peptidoglycan transglycosylase